MDANQVAPDVETHSLYFLKALHCGQREEATKALQDVCN